MPGTENTNVKLGYFIRPGEEKFLARLTGPGHWMLISSEIAVIFTLIFVTVHFNIPKHEYFRFVMLLPVFHAGSVFGYSGGIISATVCTALFLPVVPIDPVVKSYRWGGASAGVMIAFAVLFGLVMGGAIGNSRRTRKFSDTLSTGFQNISREATGRDAMLCLAREALSVIGAEYAAVMYKEPGAEGGWAVLGLRAGAAEPEEINGCAPDGILARCVESKQHFASNGPGSDKRFRTAGGIRNFIAAPVLFEGAAHGAAVVTGKSAGENFTEKDMSMLQILAEAAGVVSHNIEQEHERLEEQLRGERMKELFSRYVSASVASHVLENPDLLEGRWQEVTVLVSDIRGFTSISESMTARELVARLNEYFTAMVDVIFDNNGTIDKFVGDCIIAYWGAPVPDPEHAANAARAALGMSTALETLNAKWSVRGLEGFNNGIALHTCKVLIGNVGDDRKRAFTIMGEEVGRAMAAEAVTKDCGARIVVTPEAASGLEGFALRRVTPGDAAFNELYALAEARS